MSSAWYSRDKHPDNVPRARDLGYEASDLDICNNVDEGITIVFSEGGEGPAIVIDTDSTVFVDEFC